MVNWKSNMVQALLLYMTQSHHTSDTEHSFLSRSIFYPSNERLCQPLVSSKLPVGRVTMAVAPKGTSTIRSI